MTEREWIIRELWRRISLVPSVVYTARNPKSPPSLAQMPCIQLFEITDKVVESSLRGNYTVNKRVAQVVVEGFLRASSEQASSYELTNFMERIRKEIFRGGPSLGGLCSMAEIEGGRIMRPVTGETVIGSGIVLDIQYIEDINKLYP